jgi:flagellar assembly factor FliW
MVQIDSQQLGVLEYEDGAVLEFPAGLPGFEDQTRFLLVERPAAAPLVFLQSLSLADLCFLAVPVSAIDPDYDLAVTAEDLGRLGLGRQQQPRQNVDVLCLALLSVPEDGPLTANLLAPIVINVQNRRAVQAVRVDSRYSHQHPVTPPEPVCS